MTIRLIATDLDGTLLADPTTISERNRAALDAARAMGVEVVPVTARQPRALRPIAEIGGFTGWALCGNGGHGLHLTTGERLFEAHLEAATAQALAAALLRSLPEVMFASVRDGGEVFVAQDAYARSAAFSDHKRDPADMVVAPLADVLAEPSLKLIVRHPQLSNDDLVARVGALGLDGFEVTHSGAPFVEVLAPGVSKAWGLQQLCTHLGIEAREVLAFGDAPNDAEMLAWAGRGVAMANAAPVTLAAADEVTVSNLDDGVAQVIEAELASDRAGR
ncbi:HAD family hydrolase [Ruania albidiflava]|uniref:HAD family hydrolase n=1 Tax=Ruania albidiflava TaxID=366586 RepID=UPI0003B4CA5B|nr:HAD family hydrolase [Ruania albidiflava]